MVRPLVALLGLCALITGLWLFGVFQPGQQGPAPLEADRELSEVASPPGASAPVRTRVEVPSQERAAEDAPQAVEPQPEESEPVDPIFAGLDLIDGPLSPQVYQRMDQKLRKVLTHSQSRLARADPSDQVKIASQRLRVEQALAALGALASGSYVIVPMKQGASLPMNGTGHYWSSPIEHEGEDRALILVLRYSDFPALRAAHEQKRIARELR